VSFLGKAGRVVVRLAATLGATGLILYAILESDAQPLLRGLSAVGGGVILLLFADAWFDTAVLLLFLLAGFATAHVMDHELAPAHVKPTTLLRVPLATLQRPVRSFRAGEAIVLVLVTVVPQRRRVLVHTHPVTLEEPLCAGRLPHQLLVMVERGDSDEQLMALARDAAIAKRSYAIPTAPRPPTIAEAWTPVAWRIDALVERFRAQ